MTPEFHFDFVSPNAYFVHRVLPRMVERTGIAFDYRPISLGAVMRLANNQPPLRAFAGVKGKVEYMRIEIGRFIAKHGLTRFKFNPHFPLDTTAALRGALVAKSEGWLAPYAEAMFAAMWEDGARLDDPAVIAALVKDLGRDPDDLARRAGDPAVQAALADASAASVARGVFGAPTFFVGSEIFFGKDSLGDLEDAIMRSAGAAAR